MFEVFFFFASRVRGRSVVSPKVIGHYKRRHEELGVCEGLDPPRAGGMGRSRRSYPWQSRSGQQTLRFQGDHHEWWRSEDLRLRLQAASALLLEGPDLFLAFMLKRIVMALAVVRLAEFS